VRPIQIWSYDHGRFQDVTRRFPSYVRRDAAGDLAPLPEYRGKRNGAGRGILPAWAADEYLLGRGAVVWPTLERAREHGYLATTAGDTPRDPAAYIRALRRLLRRTGYIRS
jgi:hypothetical protein